MRIVAEMLTLEFFDSPAALRLENTSRVVFQGKPALSRREMKTRMRRYKNERARMESELRSIGRVSDRK